MSDSYLDDCFDALRRDEIVTEAEVRAILSTSTSIPSIRRRGSLVPIMAGLVAAVALLLVQSSPAPDRSLPTMMQPEAMQQPYAPMFDMDVAEARDVVTEDRSPGIRSGVGAHSMRQPFSTDRVVASRGTSNGVAVAKVSTDANEAPRVIAASSRGVGWPRALNGDASLLPATSAISMIGEDDAEPDSDFRIGAGISYGVASFDVPDLNNKLSTAGFPELPMLMSRVGVQGFVQYRRWMIGMEYVPEGRHEVEHRAEGARRQVSFSNQRTSFTGGYQIPIDDAIDLTLAYRFALNSYTIGFSSLRPAEQSSSPQRSANDEWEYMWRDMSESNVAQPSRTIYRKPFSFGPALVVSWRPHRNIDLRLDADWSFHQRTTWADRETDMTVHGAETGMELNGISIRGGASVALQPFE